MLLPDKKIIVTGGASGIGAATVRAYAREGARVAALDVQDASGRRVAAEAGDAVTYHHCDVSSREAVHEVFARVVAGLGGLDVLAHVAGLERGTPAEDIPDEEWDLVFAVNVKGTLYTNQAAFRHMQTRGGHIINFGSGAGIRGQRGSAHYSAAKGAVMAWTRTVAQEWARYGITVNSIVPAIWTPMYEAYRQRMVRAGARHPRPGDAARHPARAIPSATSRPSWSSWPATARVSSPGRCSRSTAA